MKRQLLVTMLSVWGALLAQAQQVLDLHSGVLKNEVSPTVPTRDVEQVDDGYLVTYTFDRALILPDDLYSGTMFWKMDGFGMNQNPGDPSTLSRSDLVAIPFGYGAKIEVTDSVYHDFSYELTPARQDLINSSDEGYTKQNVPAIEPYEGFKPATVASLLGVESYRNHRMCRAMVSPIQYNYSTKTVRAYTSITYKVSFVPDHTDAARSKAMPMHLSCEDNFLANNVIGGSLAERNVAKAGSSAQSDVRDYLILSTRTFRTAANRFAEWKRMLGFNVHVVLRDDWTSESVRSTVSEAYASFPSLYYLLIIGDHRDVPSQSSTVHNEPHVTDFYYGCMDDDDIPEIYCGRLPVSTSDEAAIVVDKIIYYEQTPPTSASFYHNALHCAYFQDNEDEYYTYADRRFAQTSEDVRTYVMSQGKSVQRVYMTEPNVTPLYWNNGTFSNGEPIPDELKKPGFAWDGNATDIHNAINNGVFYVLHRDHGDTWKWGKPEFTTQDISNLSNGNLLPVVFSINCLTGKFSGSCFAEKFLQKADGGCVAIFAASEKSISGHNDVLTTGMFDAIWPNPGLSINIPKMNQSFSTTPTPTYTLGQILNQGMVRVEETYASNLSHIKIRTKYTKEIFHCFGDPSMKIYTEVPTAFSNVSVMRNANSINVSLGAGETARITAYDPISGEVQSYMGSSATITTSNPDGSIICVSAHNRIPFIQNPDIMYVQNTHITGTLNETHDVIKVGNHVTSTMPTGDVTTSNANITLKARKVVLDSGTCISVGSTLKTINP